MDGYSRFHRNRQNLLIHVVAVPVFAVTSLASVASLLAGHRLLGALLAAGPVLSLAAQGYGHKREPVAPRPFRGPGDFVRRVLTEQFVTFPRFVLTGAWGRAVRADR